MVFQPDPLSMFYTLTAKVVPEGWAVTITAQPSGTTLVLGTNNNHLKKHGYRFWISKFVHADLEIVLENCKQSLLK